MGVFEYGVPNDERAVKYIKRVKDLMDNLHSREVDTQVRISHLSEETSWDMATMLDECLAYLGKLPYVREKEGIRRRLRCYSCRTEEFPEGSSSRFMPYCNTCLLRMKQAIEKRSHLKGFALYRTYTPEDTL